MLDHDAHSTTFNARRQKLGASKDLFRQLLPSFASCRALVGNHIHWYMWMIHHSCPPCLSLTRLAYQMGSEELRQRMRLLDNEIRIMRSDQDRIRHESSTQVSSQTPSQSACHGRLVQKPHWQAYLSPLPCGRLSHVLGRTLFVLKV